MRRSAARWRRYTATAAALGAVLVPALLPEGSAAAAAGHSPRAPWQAYNYSPSSRTVRPVKIYRTTGTVSHAGAVLDRHSTRISGAGSSVTLDFGKDVGGIASLHFAGSSGAQDVSLSFSESSDYVGPMSDNSTGGAGKDGALLVPVDGATSYTMPAKYLRGGFRYLTVTLGSSGWVDLDSVSLHFTAAPLMKDPADYPNYFYSSDPQLNRIWYAGAYTTQLDTIDPTTGRVWPAPAQNWDNSGTVGVGNSVLVDGAKRDRSVWPADLGIEIPTAYVAFGDTTSARNSLTTLYQHQKSTGELPYSGPEMNKYGSDTYHLWTLAATYDYYQESGDLGWLDSIWDGYQRGVDFTSQKMDANGLLSITEPYDTVRTLAKSENLSANVLFWHVLSTGARLAAAQGDSELASSYASRADALKAAINAHFWDAAGGAYRFYPDSTILPQAGNSLAVWWGLADSAQAQSISSTLTGDWDANGSTSPENKGNPGVFAGSMEVMAHFAAGGTAADQAGIDLIKREWGYMLDNPEGTNSTFWESYRSGDTSCLFCSDYASLAHGWGTGPTPALTYYVLGVDPVGVGGSSYRFAPHVGDLSFAQGRLTTTRGAIDASWKIDQRTHAYRATLDAPRGTTGEADVPTLGGHVQVRVDGRLVWNGTRAVGPLGSRYHVHADGGSVVLTGLAGGHHTLTTRRLPH